MSAALAFVTALGIASGWLTAGVVLCHAEGWRRAYRAQRARTALLERQVRAQERGQGPAAPPRRALPGAGSGDRVVIPLREVHR